ncbi:hypothetical protein HU200_048061 [Digitaria exilis]|uniref:Uncharacterized protein n=1 Tax=Digitaria exilis TaxID=1010633 RepID=A0A835AVQ3_9POAL|nr:hypothetical protein HU200_048061 [Digitaria exilis]
MAGATQSFLVDASLGLNHVQYGRAARVRHPKDGVPIRDAKRFEGLLQEAFYIRGDEIWNSFLKVEGESNLFEVALNGTVRVWQDGLCN